MSDPIIVTPAVNLSSDYPGSLPAVPAVTFLDPRSTTLSQTESNHSRSSTKRLRVGSCSTSEIQPPPKFGLLSSYLARRPSTEHETDPVRRDLTTDHGEVHSTSAIESASDREVMTNPAGSTIAQALDSWPRKIHCDLSDTDSTFSPIRFQGTPNDSTLKPSGRALIKEYFASVDPFSSLRVIL